VHRLIPHILEGHARHLPVTGNALASTEQLLVAQTFLTPSDAFVALRKRFVTFQAPPPTIVTRFSGGLGMHDGALSMNIKCNIVSGRQLMGSTGCQDMVW
jgi:hypothetical protein